MVSRDCCVALPYGATGLSAVCDCGISLLELTIFGVNLHLFLRFTWCIGYQCQFVMSWLIILPVKCSDAATLSV